MKSQRKKKPLPLHVSQARINAERANVILRTNNRIDLLTAAAAAEQDQIALLAAAAQQDRVALLAAAAQQDRIPLLAEKENWHCCLNTICQKPKSVPNP
jgi:hypothetical protein